MSEPPAGTVLARPGDLKAEQETQLSGAFARALAAKDFESVERLLHPQIAFRGLTPGNARYLREAHDPQKVITDILQQWFEPTDRIEKLLSTESDRFN